MMQDALGQSAVMPDPRFTVALLLCLLAVAPAAAQEVLVDCVFHFKPLSPEQKAKTNEREAMEWFDSADFTLRVGADRKLTHLQR
jgi:hypothetical protein